MKNILLFLSFLGITIVVDAQSFEWARSFGSSNFDMPWTLGVDPSGNVYTAGRFLGTVDFDPGPGVYEVSSVGGTNAFIHKMDASGNFLWVKTLGGTSSVIATSIGFDAQGNIYTVGYFYGTGDFDPGVDVYNLTSNGANLDIFVQKMDDSGNFIWAKSIGGTGNDIANAIAVDNLGNIHITGAFQGTVDFDPGVGTNYLGNSGGYDIFVLKMNSSGDFLWAQRAGGPSDDTGDAITVDMSGNVYTTGGFQGTVDFDPGTGTTILNSLGDRDVFVQKLDDSGNFLWAKSFGSTLYDNVEGIAIDVDGNVYTTGSFQGTVDFDPGIGVDEKTSVGGLDIFVHKMDEFGDYEWVRTFGEVSTDEGRGIATDPTGDVYVTGYFRETVDFDPSPAIFDLSSNGQQDAFVQKLNPDGDLVWAEAFGGLGEEKGASVKLDVDGNVYTTGTFNWTVDFDFGAGISELTPVGDLDVYVHKIKPCSPSASTDPQVACYSYTWIDGNEYNSNNNTATFTLTNAAGCDSVVTLNLTINTVTDITTNTDGLTITAINTNATYQWLDCDDNYAIISGETGQEFTATVNGNYAVELTESTCIDTSSCVAITTIGIGELGLTILRVYPNPGSDFLTIVTSIPTTAVITSANGLLLRTLELNEESSIDVSTYAPGVYFIRTAEGQTMKFIKE